MMTAMIDTRPPARTMRSVLFQPQERSQTRSPAAGQAVIAGMARQLFRGHPVERPAHRRAILGVIRASHRPHELVNAVVDEAVCRGGMYGLELAADVLSELPDLLLEAIRAYSRRDSARRAHDRALPHPRYRVADMSWGVFLDALAGSDLGHDTPGQVLAALRRVARTATDGMSEGLAVAAARLAQRRPEARDQAEVFLRAMLERGNLWPGSRRIVTDTLAEIGD